ncbi:MAG: DUF4097 family beta strand repeat-containing protein [Ruminiclostridium sp.]
MLNKLNIKKITLWLSVTIIACFAIATMLFFQIDIKNFKDNNYQYDVNEEKTFETGDIKDIIVDSFISDINIIEYDDTKVKVHVYGKLYTKNKNEENNPMVELINGTLNIKENRKSIVHVGINLNIGELFQRNEMQIDLFVPKSYSENMKIDSSSGSVKADSLKLKELAINTFSGDIELNDVTADAVRLETSSGLIKAGNIEANNIINIDSFSGNSIFESIKAEEILFENSSGNMSFGIAEAEKITGDTFSGNITAEKLKAEDADISTSSGKIDFKNATIKKIKSETFSGDITFNNATINDSDIDTSSGSVTIKLIEGSEFALEADSSSGNVACDFPLNIEKQGEHELKGVVGNAANKIKIDTFSGDIKISK